MSVIERNNKLTAYGFSCGYTEFIENLTIQKELYKEHGIYHVRSLYNNTPELNTKFTGHTSHNYVVWESFHQLSAARDFYRKIK